MHPDPYQGLGEWFDGPQGAAVLRTEAAILRTALDDVFGFELLQVGAWGPARPLLEGARTQHTTLVAPRVASGVTLCAPLVTLPFAADSVDAVLLPHTLELVEDPYAVLRDAERVLRPEGCLLICGFNPWSGWGASRLFAKALRRPVFPPQARRLVSEGRLRDWVAVLGLDVVRVQGYLGSLPLAATATSPLLQRNPLLAGAYLLKARKRVQTLTRIRPRRRARKRRRVLVPVAEPTTRARS